MENAMRVVANHIYYNQTVLVEELLSRHLLDAPHRPNKEVLEWWLVSDWIAERLKREGEIVLSSHECHWWGRQVSGQALYMDTVIERLCR